MSIRVRLPIIGPPDLQLWVGHSQVAGEFAREEREAPQSGVSRGLLRACGSNSWRNCFRTLKNRIDLRCCFAPLLQGMMAGHKAVYDCIKAFSETDFTEDLKRFDVPTLILHGDDDQIVPIGAAAYLSSKLVKGAKLKVFPGAPHGMCSTLKNEINADLLASLQPKRILQTLRDLCSGTIGSVERSAQVFKELRSVVQDTLADLVEYLQGQAARIRRGFQHEPQLNPNFPVFPQFSWRVERLSFDPGFPLSPAKSSV